MGFTTLIFLLNCSCHAGKFTRKDPASFKGTLYRCPRGHGKQRIIKVT
jgi:hypothetical protein